MFCLNLHRDLELDPQGLEADDLHVVGHVLAIRMVIAVAFFKRIFTQSLPMNQAHGLIIADVYRSRCVSTSSSRASPSNAFGTTFWIAFALTALALLPAFLLPARRRSGDDFPSGGGSR